MEPRPFSRGYTMTLSHLLRIDDTFNGATAFQPWIQIALVNKSLKDIGLQWSHGLSAVDTRSNCLTAIIA